MQCAILSLAPIAPMYPSASLFCPLFFPPRWFRWRQRPCFSYQKAGFSREFLSLVAGMVLADGTAIAKCVWRNAELMNPAEGGGHEG